MYGDAATLHSPEPRHLPLGELVDGYFELLGHCVGIDTPCDEQGDVFVFKSIVDEIFWRQSVVKQAADFVGHALSYSFAEASADVFSPLLAADADPHRQAAQVGKCAAFNRLPKVVFFDFYGADGPFGSVYVCRVVQGLVAGEDSREFSQALRT